MVITSPHSSKTHNFNGSDTLKQSESKSVTIRIYSAGVMRAARDISVLLFVILVISVQTANGCELLKKFLMGNKASTASTGGSMAMKSIFDFKVDAISGVVDLATYKYVFRLPLSFSTPIYHEQIIETNTPKFKSSFSLYFLFLFHCRS